MLLPFIFSVPFFGEMGEYDGVPGVYSANGTAASEAENAIGSGYCTQVAKSLACVVQHAQE